MPRAPRIRSTQKPPASAWVMHADGASRGNPGQAGAGAVLYDAQGAWVDSATCYLGRATNNEAEYQGVILGLALAVAHAPEHLIIRLDSQLVVRQLRGEYKVRNDRLAKLYAEAQELLRKLQGCTIEHVRRELNGDADTLANRAIDER